MTIGFRCDPFINADQTQPTTTCYCAPHHDANTRGSSNIMSVCFLTLHPDGLIGIISDQVEPLFVCKYYPVSHLLTPANVWSGKNKAIMVMLGHQMLSKSNLFMTELVSVKFSSDCVIWYRELDRFSKFRCSGMLVFLELIDQAAVIMHRQLGGPPLLLWIHGFLMDDVIDGGAMKL